jgi:hypothetical protein
VAVVSLPARGWPPQAATRRAGLEFVEKLLTTKLTGPDVLARVPLDRSVSPDGFRCLD